MTGDDMAKNPFIGAWRITEMEMWDRDYLDLMVPAHLTISKDGMGEFQFGTVHGWLDCRFGKREGAPLVEFSWQGQSDIDEACRKGIWKNNKNTVLINLIDYSAPFDNYRLL